MTENEINFLLTEQKKYYKSGATLPISFRKEQLKKLYSAIQEREKELNEALKKDLGKSQFEAFLCESGFILTEIRHMIKNIKKFIRKLSMRSAFRICSIIIYAYISHHNNWLLEETTKHKIAIILGIHVIIPLIAKLNNSALLNINQY